MKILTILAVSLLLSLLLISLGVEHIAWFVLTGVIWGAIASIIL